VTEPYVVSGETDLIAPRPAAGESWNPETIHTHFFGCPVPEAAMSIFTYIRYIPAFGCCQGGVLVYQGMDNLVLTDLAFHDYRLAMPWPEIDGSRFTTVNGLSFDFVEPGRRTEIAFDSSDGTLQLRMTATAVTPMAARGHVLPDEEAMAENSPGGSEQFLHFAGELTLDGARIAIDSDGIRDRSWRQVRSERREANLHPPICWTPVYFDESFAFNTMSFESPDTNPPWLEAFPLPADVKTHVFGWVSRDGEVRPLRRVHRRDLTRHPVYLHPLSMEIELEDEGGEISHVKGEAIAFAPIPQWYNVSTHESIMRWEDDRGKVAYGQVQSIWNWRAQQAMRSARTIAL
jgi:hypothetical protein